MIQQQIYRRARSGYRVVALSRGLVGKGVSGMIAAQGAMPVGMTAVAVGAQPVYRRVCLEDGCALMMSALDPNGDRSSYISHQLWFAAADASALFAGPIIPPADFRSAYAEQAFTGGESETGRLPELEPLAGAIDFAPACAAAARIFGGDAALLAQFLAAVRCLAYPGRGYAGVCVIADGGAVSGDAYLLMEAVLRAYPERFTRRTGYRTLWNRAEDNSRYPVFFTTPAVLEAEPEELARYVVFDLPRAARTAPAGAACAEAAEDVRLAKSLIAGDAAAVTALREGMLESERAAARKSREEAEQQRLAEEAEQKRQAEAAERRRLAAEAEKKRLAEEAAERKRLAAEKAAEEKRLAEEAEKKRQAEEAAEKKRLAAEKAAEEKRLAEEAAERERQAEEAEQKKRLAEEAAEKKRAAAETEENRPAAGAQQKHSAAQAEEKRPAAGTEQKRAAAEAEKVPRRAEEKSEHPAGAKKRPAGFPAEDRPRAEAPARKEAEDPRLEEQRKQAAKLKRRLPELSQYAPQDLYRFWERNIFGPEKRFDPEAVEYFLGQITFLLKDGSKHGKTLDQSALLISEISYPYMLMIADRPAVRRAAQLLYRDVGETGCRAFGPAAEAEYQLYQYMIYWSALCAAGKPVPKEKGHPIRRHLAACSPRALERIQNELYELMPALLKKLTRDAEANTRLLRRIALIGFFAECRAAGGDAGWKADQSGQFCISRDAETKRLLQSYGYYERYCEELTVWVRRLAFD